MKQVRRVDAPECLDFTNETRKQRTIGFYDNLRDSNGNIRPRWNTITPVDGVSSIRRKLYDMSQGHCAYCGKCISISEMDVDHYLPSSKFPYLSYCWDNLLPSCKYCNQNLKGDFFPMTLEKVILAEEIYTDKLGGSIVFNKSYLLQEVSTVDRLIDPTFDNPEEHLEFVPDFCMYRSKTKIGEETNNKFFRHKEVALRWKGFSDLMKNCVLNETATGVVQNIIAVIGYEHVCNALYEYWLQEKSSGRLYSNT